MNVCDAQYLGVDRLYEVCNKLQNNSARTVKEKIIEENMKYEDFKSLLLFLFDNSVTTGLDIKKIGKEVSSDYIIESVYSFKNLLDYVKTHNTGKDIDVLNVRSSIYNVSNGNEEYIRFLEEVVTKSLRLGIDAKTINKVFDYEFIPTFDVQLGTSIENVKLNGDEEIFISQKLNGTRCVYWRGDLWTRSGKKYTGCQHIINDIQKLCEEDFCINPNEVVFDGELVLKSCGLSDSEAFQKGTGIANSKNETKEELEYVIFDTMSSVEFEAKYCARRYGDRRSSLEGLPEVFNRLGLQNIRIVPFFYRGYDHEKIWEYLDYAEANDMEGVIVNLDTEYVFKRTKNLIKVKKFFDIDLKCIRIEQGEKGKYKNTLGAIVCKYKDGEVKVGSGFTEEDRDEYFNNPEKIIDKVITVKYKEATKNKDGSESLQFPVFVCVRQDKMSPDC
jgi:DNA ligase-1